MLARLQKWIRQPPFPELTGHMRRPAIFALLFWSVLAVTCVSYVLRLNDEEWTFGLVPVAIGVAALVAAWLAMPWSPLASGRRKLVAPAFLAATLLVGYLTGSVWSLGLYVVPFANGVFLFGFGWGIAYAAAVFPVIFANYAFVLVRLPGENDLDPALLLMLMWVPVGVFVIGTCAAIVEAIQRREQTRELLEELRLAHAKLERYAASVRELSVSEERTRMAREIHDSVGHYLTVVNVQLEAAAKTMDRKPEKAREEVERAKTLASEALTEVRRSVRALRPLAVEERAGAGALRALARGFAGPGPDVYFEVRGNERELPPETELVLFRALQEGLTNALKHSESRRVRAGLSFEPSRVRLTVKDDGRGSPGGPPRHGVGLSGLGERVSALGGALTAKNAGGGGFALEVELPTLDR